MGILTKRQHHGWCFVRHLFQPACQGFACVDVIRIYVKVDPDNMIR
jgi:hypothetical protein